MGCSIFGLLIYLERRRPLRNATESKLTRGTRNLSVAAIGALAIQVAEKPVTDPLAALVERRRWGLLQQARLPRWLEGALAVLLLDYTLYIWHVLTHRVSFLWRFHQVHHVDLDMDATTGLRFHFGELAISTLWRAAQVLGLGVSQRSLSLWQTLTIFFIMFHHSNVKLPLRVERWLCRLIVTPRMHGIHHSIVAEETDSNWSSGLMVWDRIHGTLRLNIAHDEIEIGVPAYRDPHEVTLPRLMEMPFGEQRATWQLPAGGRPARKPSPLPPDHLLD